MKEKSRAKNVFAVVKRAVAKVYLCEKNLRKVSGTWREITVGFIQTRKVVATKVIA